MLPANVNRLKRANDMTQSTTAATCAGQEPSAEQANALLDDLNISADTNLIGLLQDVQGHFGYLPADAIKGISRRTMTPLSRIYGVISFYAQFYTEPRGRHTVLCCRGTACHVRGASGILDAIKRTLDVEDGQSTSDLKFYLETVACLGTCFLAPVMMIDDEYFGSLTQGRVEKILKNYGTDE